MMDIIHGIVNNIQELKNNMIPGKIRNILQQREDFYILKKYQLLLILVSCKPP